MKDFEGKTNWSEVAQRAFEQEIASLGQREKEKDMQAMIDRMKATKSAAMSKEKKTGYSQGVSWAMNCAEYRQLEALETLQDEQMGAGDVSDYGFALAAKLVHVTMGQESDHGDIKELHEQMFADTTRTYSEEFVEGFIEGALAQWDKVKDQV